MQHTINEEILTLLDGAEAMIKTVPTRRSGDEISAKVMAKFIQGAHVGVQNINEVRELCKGCNSERAAHAFIELLQSMCLFESVPPNTRRRSLGNRDMMRPIQRRLCGVIVREIYNAPLLMNYISHKLDIAAEQLMFGRGTHEMFSFLAKFSDLSYVCQVVSDAALFQPCLDSLPIASIVIALDTLLSDAIDSHDAASVELLCVSCRNFYRKGGASGEGGPLEIALYHQGRDLCRRIARYITKEMSAAYASSDQLKRMRDISSIIDVTCFSRVRLFSHITIDPVERTCEVNKSIVGCEF